MGATAWLAILLGAGQGPMVGLPFDAARAAKLRQEWAKAWKLEEGFDNSVGMKLVLIPGGRFSMGPNGSTWRVSLSRPYYLAATEATMGQYRKWKAGHKVPGAEDAFNEDDRPAAMASWDDATAYCKWLSEQPAEKKAGRVYHLPTEAQWEWAARAGTTTTRHYGDSEKGQKEHSWYNVTYTPNPKHEGKGRGRQPVARLLPNAWGLHDMLGNVWEFCSTRYGPYPKGPATDPGDLDPKRGFAVRGGGWSNTAADARCASRNADPPHFCHSNLGFRVALTVE
jgi:formylglycine-generating enzyme required for sulfatase activity